MDFNRLVTNLFYRQRPAVSPEKWPRGSRRTYRDTTTGAPASGPAALPGPAPEQPGRRPALRPRMPTFVAVSRCAQHQPARSAFGLAASQFGPSLVLTSDPNRVLIQQVLPWFRATLSS